MLKNYALLKVSPRTLRAVVKYLEDDLGLEIIGQNATITPDLITTRPGMMNYGIERVLALRTALYNDVPSVESELLEK